MKNTGKSKKILLVVLAVVLLLASITGVMIGIFSSKEEETAAPTIGVVREAEPEVIQVSTGAENNIRDAEVLGLWNDARLGGDGYGPGKTYDNKKASKWNPAACNGYLGDPSIVYLLDGRFDMDRWEMILSARELFFDFYVSSDGQEFTLLQSITKENYQNFYKTEGDRFYLTLETPEAKGIAFVKLCFTGSNSENNTPWMSVHDVRCIGTRLGDGPSKMPKFEDPYKVDKLELLSYELTGKWHEDQSKVAEVGPARTFDGNIYSMWNPGAQPRFEGNPGIIYHLAKPQDIGKMQFYFGKYRHYFNVYVSKDGKNYTPVALISFANEAEAYSEDPNGIQICTLDGLDLKDIQHIKLIFTGRSDNAAPWVVLYEVLTFKEGTKGLDTSWMTRTEPISTHPWIEAVRIIGEWKNNREKDLSWSRYKTYDKDKNTFWNPEAKANYAGDPGILFALKKEMDLNEVQLTFGTDPYYFDLYVSKNGKDYSKIADISWANADKAYKSLGNNRYLCTLDSLELEDVKYIKLVFTGRKNGAPWVSLHDVSLSEEGQTGLDTSWMLRTEPESKHPWIDTSTLIGSWKNDREKDVTPDWNRFKAYDTDPNTFWNPEAKPNYADEPGVIFTLKSAMDIGKLEFNFGSSANVPYFNVFVSKNGTDYTQIAQITADNEAKAYPSTGLCVLDGLTLEDITHVKLVFTGRKGGNFWISFYEASFSEEGTAGLDTSWMMPSVNTHPTIASAAITGTWNQDRADSSWSVEKTADGNASTFWNPEAKPNYTDDPGVIFTLKSAMDIGKLEFNFGSSANVPYFNVFVSKNGTDYTQIAQITADNEAKAYPSAGLCMLDGLTLEDITHVKLVFTGRKGGNFWISFYEVTVSEEGTAGLDTSWMMSSVNTHPTIASAAITGTWNNPQANSGWSVEKAADGKTSTFWNPEAKPNYADEPGVIFTLKSAMDIGKLEFNFGTNVPYFNVFVSKNGTDYTQLAQITADNEAKAYPSAGLCVLDGLTLEDITHVKLVFTGRKGGSFWISFYEATVSEEGTAGLDTSWMLPTVTPPEEDEGNVTVASAALTGTWVVTQENSASYSPAKTYDNNKTTYWNPGANTGYAGDPGIVYTLDGSFDITKLELTFGNRYMYFDVQVSADGSTYTDVASVDAGNYATYYTDGYVCTIDGLTAQSVKYIKLVFTGDSQNKCWISFYELDIVGAVAEEPPVTEEKGIASAAITGTWNQDRADSSWSVEKAADGDTTTFWNPEAKPNYTDDPGVIFTLKSAMDIGKLEFNFGSSANVPYFNVFVSKNGTDYTQIAQITADNEAKAYPSTGLCVLDGLTLEDITHVKLVFTGRKGGNFWISFYEVTVSEEGTAGLDTSWMLPTVTPPEEDEGNVTVASAAITGTWNNPQANSDWSVEKAADGKTSTFWNPEAKPNYTDDPGVIFTLKSAMDIGKLEFNFGTNVPYFNVFVSKNGTDYTQIAQITADNEAKAYPSAGLCVLDGLTLEDITHVKLVFTGRKGGNFWISFYEVTVSEEGTAGLDTSWMMPTVTPPEEDEGNVSIASAALTGIWNNPQANSGWSVEKAADGDTTTFWNPEAKPNYTDDPGVIFTLKSAMDIGKLEFNFGTNVPYFNVFVSKNGTDYTQLAQITADNEAKAYPSAGLCMLDGLTLEDITHIKLVFTGRKGGSFWISFYEATVSEEGTAGLDTSWMLPTVTPPEEDEGNVTVASAALTGTWVVTQENSASYSPAKTYDNNKTTYWNPGANTGYAGDPGIVYTLDGSFDITKLELTFGNRYMYFDVQVSADGSTYTDVASVNAGNYATYYTDGYVCTIDGLTAQSVKYIKFVFTGDSQNKCWISFYELDIVGAVAEEPPVTEEKGIASAAITGTWNQDRADSSWSVEKTADGDTTTFWNPEAKPNYTDDPGVIFTLKSAMDIGKLEFNFGTNVPYFNVFVSKNGTDYTQLAQITADNEAKAYPSAGLCMLDGLTLEDITHIKLVFTGRKGGSFWISFYEATVSEEGTAGLDTSWMLPTVTPPEEDEGNVSIASAALTGTWVVTQENSASYSPAKTYDNNKTTYWNPGANTGYAGDPGIVYTLDGSFDITKLELTFGNRYMYFDVQVSADGSTYTDVASVNAGNYATYYTDGYVCTIDGLTAQSVKYIKLVFTGDSQNKCWISFYELEIAGTACRSGGEEL